MICRRSRRLQRQRTPRAPSLKSIPEEKSVRFVSRRSSGKNNNNATTGDNDDDSAMSFFPGLLERDFEDVDVSLVNRSRVVRNVDPLRRSRHLDTLAQAHAESMAERQHVQHSVHSVEALQHKLHSEQVGENVLRGKSVYQIHRDTLEKPESFLYSNMMSNKYNEMGSGARQRWIRLLGVTFSLARGGLANTKTTTTPHSPLSKLLFDCKHTKLVSVYHYHNMQLYQN
jgi:uncharacterized protein YkwD